MVRRLWPEDVARVVAYDDEVPAIAEPETGSDQHDLPQRIQAIETGGSTNLSCGWLRGHESSAGASGRARPFCPATARFMTR